MLRKYHNLRNESKNDHNDRVFAEKNVEKIIEHLEQFVMRLKVDEWKSMIENCKDEELYARELVILLEKILKERDT